MPLTPRPRLVVAVLVVVATPKRVELTSVAGASPLVEVGSVETVVAWSEDGGAPGASYVAEKEGKEKEKEGDRRK